MKRVALLGFPLGHSVSPAIHNAAFQALNLSWRYESQETKPSQLADTTSQLRGKPWAGANVTIPYKEQIIPLLDELAPPAKAIGAVNTILNHKGRLCGYNTDLQGFMRQLEKQEIRIEGQRAMILGAGGAARAVAYGLSQRGAHLCIICRRKRPGQEMARLLSSFFHNPIEVLPWTPASFRASSAGCGLIVNTTPVGMSPHLHSSPWPPAVPFPENAFLYDLIYNPPETRLVADSIQAGLRASGGVGMLVEQAALAFQLWTGREPPRKVMCQAAKSALEISNA